MNASRLVRALTRKSFPLFQSVGVHVTPVHYYSPIPDTSALDPGLYERRIASPGLSWNAPCQIALAANLARYVPRYTPQLNWGLSLLDAFVLYGMIRERKPTTVIEIGSGDSTQIILDALADNRRDGSACAFYSIEPYPSAQLLALYQHHSQNVVPITAPVQSVDLSLLAQADLLFIDSTHVSKIGSDVNYEILHIVPSLAVGALIHWHDIPLPFDYWRDVVEHGNMFWNEAYLLHAFLLFNQAFQIRWASRYLQVDHESVLKQYFPFYRSHARLSSLWVERVA